MIIIKKTKNFLYKSIRYILRNMPSLGMSTNEICIIRTDNIGDYILFRNFLPFIRQSEQYKSAKITLIGNEKWRDITEHFDAKYIDEAIWLNMDDYEKKRMYRIRINIKLRLKRAQLIINTVHSRTTLIDDIIAHSGIKNSITCEGDTINFRNIAAIKLKGLYSEIIPSLPHTTFEFFRNKYFMGQLLKQKIDIEKPFFEQQTGQKKTNVISCFVGASDKSRQWSPENYAELIKIIYLHYPYLEFQILGSLSDVDFAEKIIKYLPEIIKINNLCGTTTLVDLINKIAESALLLSNETGAVHIAAAVNTPTVCISNGKHFGRFNPYPLSISPDMLTVYPNKTFYDPENFESLSRRFEVDSHLDIQEIAPDWVFEKVKYLMEKNK